MTSGETLWQVPVGPETTSAAWDPPTTGTPGSVFVCAHGAGGHMADKSLLAISEVLRSREVGVVRFNFLYREQRSSRPDPMPRLIRCFTAVLDRVRQELKPRTLIIGGRSMGGRAASMMAAEGTPASGLLLLAYPLHPPGQQQKLRDAHLPAIQIPVLCLNGTRDTFCDRPLMEAVLARLGTNWQMRWLEGADHGFHVLKRSGRTDGMVLTEVADTVREWIARLPP